MALGFSSEGFKFGSVQSLIPVVGNMADCWWKAQNGVSLLSEISFLTSVFRLTLFNALLFGDSFKMIFLL